MMAHRIVAAIVGMNAAALKFVPKRKMQAEGHGVYVSLVEPPK
jgi:hypothetical protein